MDTSSSDLRKAIDLAKSGNRSAAQEILVHLVKQEPHNEMAWLWLADTLLEDKQRIPVLREALRRNPESILIAEALQKLIEMPLEEDEDENYLNESLSERKSDTLNGEADPDDPDFGHKLATLEPAVAKTSPRTIFRDVLWVFLLILFLGIIIFIWLWKGSGSSIPQNETAEMTLELSSTIPLPTITRTPSPSLIPTIVPTLSLSFPIGVGTPLPAAAAVIGAENVAEVEQIARWGRGSLIGAAWSPDGREAAVIFSRGIDFYDVDSGKKKETWWLNPVPKKIVYSPDGKMLAAFSDLPGAYLMLRDGKGAEIPLAEYPHPLFDLTFSPNGSLIAGAGSDGKVILWQVETGEIAQVFDDHAGKTSSVAFSNSGRMLASGGQDGDIVIRNLEENVRIGKLKGHNRQVNKLAFSPNGLVLASASQDMTVRLWDIYTQKEQFRLEGHQSPVTALAFSHDGLILASGGGDGYVRFWGAGIGVQLDAIRIHQGMILDIAYSPQGDVLLSSGEDGAVNLLVKNKENQLLPVNVASYLPMVGSVAIRPQEDMVAQGLADGRIRIISLMDGRELTILENSRSAVTALAFSPDGALLAAGDEKGAVRVWLSFEKGQSLTLNNHRAEISSLAFSEDSRILISSSEDGTIRQWNLAIPQEISAIQTYIRANQILFSPDGKLILAGLADNTLRAWQIETGQEVGAFAVHSDEIAALDISPDGKVLASAGRDGVILLWQTDDLTVLQKLKADGKEFRSVDFTHAGNLLASVNVDGNIQVWDILRGQLLYQIDQPGESIMEVRWVNNDRYLVGITRDGFVDIWAVMGQLVTGGISESGQEEENSSQVDTLSKENLPAPLYFIAAADGIDQIWRMETDGKTVTQITFEDDPVTGLDVSPANGTLAYVSGNRLILAEGDGSNRRVLVEGEEISPASQESRWKKQISDPLWSPSGTRLAYSLNGVVVYDFTYDYSVRYITNVIHDPAKSSEMRIYRPVLWSPRESRLFASVDLLEGRSLVILPTDGEAVIMPQGIEACCQLSWHVNGYEVWLGSSGDEGMPGGLWRIDAVEGGVSTVIEPVEDGKIQTFAAFPKQAEDGSLYSFFAEDTTGRDTPFSLVITDEDGQSNRRLLRSDSYRNIQEVLWAPDASLLILETEKSGIYLLQPKDVPALALPAKGHHLRWGVPTGTSSEKDTTEQIPPAEEKRTKEDLQNLLRGMEVPLTFEEVRLIGRPKIANEDTYGITVARYENTVMIWLMRYLYTDPLGTDHNRIEDILFVPYAPAEYFWSFGGCQLNDQPAPDILVMGPATQKLDERKIIFAWKINSKTYRFDPIMTNGLTCSP